MDLVIKPLTPDRLDDLGRLFSTDPVAAGCWCMWFIIPVKDYHAAGGEGNRASFTKLAAESDLPMGLLACNDAGEPVGWCAVGPRSRYVRALKTPTYKGGAPEDDSPIWLVPCFFTREDIRGLGVTAALLEAAVELARQNGATALDGFPFSGAAKRSSGDVQVGFESLFASCGFRPIRTPSSSRIVMRRDLR
jgi:GNAT superfamily N-acetyltransferase